MRELIARLARDSDEALALARVLDLAQQAERRGQQAGDFLEPRLQQLTTKLMSRQTQVQVDWQGGYTEAERKRIVLYRPMSLPANSCALLLLKADKELQHRDCLGSLLGLGLRREKVGDIVLAGASGYLIVAQEVGEFVAANLMRVGRQDVAVNLVDVIADLEPVPPKVITTTVASMRLDAIMAAGFDLSRSDAGQLIKAEKVKVNYLATVHPDQQLQEGDLISVRGYGRLKLILLGGKNRKARQRLTLERY
ncbi:MAG: RNA-binding protein [Methylocystaceae bacterium]